MRMKHESPWNYDFGDGVECDLLTGSPIAMGQQPGGYVAEASGGVIPKAPRGSEAKDCSEGSERRSRRGRTQARFRQCESG
jgi:hypothetical protein